jgi:hypothetical protein
LSLSTILQILELLLASDNGATAQYIQNQELVRKKGVNGQNILKFGFHQDVLLIYVVCCARKLTQVVVGLVVQIEELLTPVRLFVRDTGDASFTVSVVSLIKNAVQLSCRPGTPYMLYENCICMYIKAVHEIEFCQNSRRIMGWGIVI